jgi:hypothetical protein
MNRRGCTISIVTAKHSSTVGRILAFQGLSRLKLWVRTSNKEDYFFYLEQLDASGVTQLWHDKGWSDKEKDFVRRHRLVSFIGATALTVLEIAKIGECHQ